MDFGKLLDALADRITQPKNKPSVIGNVIGGRPWNQNLPRFGGQVDEGRMQQNPSIISPLATGRVLGGQAAQSVPTAVPTATPTPTPAPTAAPTPTPAPRNFEQLVTDIMSRNQIPIPVGLGIAQVEGGTIGENNPFNIEAFDSNPQNARDYASPEEGIQAFADLINKDPRYSKALQYRDNPHEMINAIAEAGYAGDVNTWKQRSIEQARAVGKRGAGEDFDSWADFVRATRPYRRFQ